MILSNTTERFWQVSSLCPSHLRHVYDISQSSLFQIHGDRVFLTAPNACFQPVCCPAIISVPFPLFLINGAPLCNPTSHLAQQLLLPCPDCYQLSPILSHGPYSKTLSLLPFFSLLPGEVARIVGGKELLLEQSWLPTEILRSSMSIRGGSPQRI